MGQQGLQTVTKCWVDLQLSMGHQAGFLRVSCTEAVPWFMMQRGRRLSKGQKGP